MKKTIISIVAGILVGIGLLLLILTIRQSYIIKKYIEVENNYEKLEQYETIMNENKKRLNNYNNENNIVSLSCINSIKKFTDASEETYFVGNINLKTEIIAYFNSYSNKINLIFEEIKNTCALGNETTNIVSLFMMSNNLIISEDYSDYVTNYKEKAQLISKEPSTNQMSRILLKMNEARLIELVINDVLIK